MIVDQGARPCESFQRRDLAKLNLGAVNAYALRRQFREGAREIFRGHSEERGEHPLFMGKQNSILAALPRLGIEDLVPELVLADGGEIIAALRRQ